MDPRFSVEACERRLSVDSRNPKRTPVRASVILQNIAAGMTLAGAAARAGIDDNTLYRWKDNDPEFAQMVREAMASYEAKATSVIEAAMPQNWQAAAWWLERRMPKEYGRQQRVDVAVDVRVLVQRLAMELGLDEQDIMAEAERLLLGSGEVVTVGEDEGEGEESQGAAT